MSEDEVMAALLSGAAGAFAWIRWYAPIASVPRLGARSQARPLLSYAPLVCLTLLFIVLRTAASYDVRDSGIYVTLYLVLGAGWVGTAALFTPWFGVSARNDAVERDNAAAAVALAGALVAVTLCYAGGNVGDGPGWWVVLYCALLATGTLALLWHTLERFAEVAEQITVERDVAAGTRLAGFLIACGIVLGRAVAGDWSSAEATLFDFVRFGWPTLVLLVVAIVTERRLRVSVEQPNPDATSQGVVPALLYVGLAGAYVVLYGAIV